MDTRDNKDNTLRSSEAAKYGLDRQNADESIRSADKDANGSDKDRKHQTEDDDANDTDWGNVDPDSGPAPTAPGSAV